MARQITLVPGAAGGPQHSSSTRQVDFALVDVFAQEPLSGNPLAVVPGADGLDDDVMRRIAREFNQSETTFLLHPTRDAEWRLRSFTAAGVEVDGAGHNALGAWWWLAESGAIPLDDGWASFRQEIGDDVLEVEVLAEAGSPKAIAMWQGAPRYQTVLTDCAELASALGLTSSDLDVPDLRPQVVSTGVAHLMVPVRDRDALARARPDAQRLAAVLRSCGAEGCYIFALATSEPDTRAHTRFFNPTVGIAEDPATGTAAGPLACYLIVNAISPEGRIGLIQGEDMGRRSRIELDVRGAAVRLLGSAVTVAAGKLRVP